MFISKTFFKSHFKFDEYDICHISVWTWTFGVESRINYLCVAWPGNQRGHWRSPCPHYSSVRPVSQSPASLPPTHRASLPAQSGKYLIFNILRSFYCQARQAAAKYLFFVVTVITANILSILMIASKTLIDSVKVCPSFITCRYTVTVRVSQ